MKTARGDAAAATWRPARLRYHTCLVRSAVRACGRSASACHAMGGLETKIWDSLATFRDVPAADWNMFYTSSSALIVPRGVGAGEIAGYVAGALRTGGGEKIGVKC